MSVLILVLRHDQDFPLTGFTEVRYDEEVKRVVCEPLEMTQVSKLCFTSLAVVWSIALVKFNRVA